MKMHLFPVLCLVMSPGIASAQSLGVSAGQQKSEAADAQHEAAEKANAEQQKALDGAAQRSLQEIIDTIREFLAAQNEGIGSLTRPASPWQLETNNGKSQFVLKSSNNGSILGNNGLILSNDGLSGPSTMPIPLPLTAGELAIYNAWQAGSLQIVPDASLPLNQGQAPMVVQSAVPEPASWLMMILGTGLVGVSLRRAARTRAARRDRVWTVRLRRVSARA